MGRIDRGVFTMNCIDIRPGDMLVHNKYAVLVLAVKAERDLILVNTLWRNVSSIGNCKVRWLKIVAPPARENSRKLVREGEEVCTIDNNFINLGPFNE